MTAGSPPHSPPSPGGPDDVGSGAWGLSPEEAARRLEAGLGNVEPATGETTSQVIRRNALTFFNVVLFSLIAALVAAGEVRDGLFVGLVVAANVVIATVQELVATRRLQALRALTAPTATVIRDGEEVEVPASQVVQGDLLHLRRGDQVVADGPVLHGSVEVDEALLTGESQTVRREAGEALRSGVFCVSGECRYRAERVGAEAYALRLAADTHELVRRTTPLMTRFDRLLRVILTATALLAALLFIQFNVQDRGFAESLRATTATVTTIVPVGLLLGITVVTAVGALRVSRSGSIVQDMYAVEALNYVDVIAFDKTGTLTSNRLVLDQVQWVDRDAPGWLAAFAAIVHDESAVGTALATGLAGQSNGARSAGRVPFNSDRRWSAVELDLDGHRRTFVMGAPETILAACAHDGGLRESYATAAAEGRRGLVLGEASTLPDPEQRLSGLAPLALLTFTDELRGDVVESFTLMETLNIEPKVISGDHPRTVVGILRQLGVTARGEASGDTLDGLPDEAFRDIVEHTMVFGRISPALKARIVGALKDNGHFVAMVGDGANDVPALREADVAVVMASGTTMARGVAGIVLLRDSFAALIRGTREATFVLGNTGLLAKLFVAKSVYAYVLILATNLLGLEFPFLPRQGGVVSTLSLGIPALLVSVSNPPSTSTQDFTMRIVRFALPAGVALGVCAMGLQFIVEGLLGRSVEESRTLVSLTLTIVGLAYFVEVFGLDEPRSRLPWRALVAAVVALLLLMALVATVQTEWTRTFFEFAEVSAIGWTSVAVASIAALLGRYWLSRNWRRMVAFVTAQPSAEDRPRGRAL